MSLQVSAHLMEAAEDEILKLRDTLKRTNELLEAEKSTREHYAQQLEETRQNLSAAKKEIKLLKEEVKDESNRKNYEFGRYSFAESKRIENAEQIDAAWTALGEENRRLRAVSDLSYAIKFVVNRLKEQVENTRAQLLR